MEWLPYETNPVLLRNGRNVQCHGRDDDGDSRAGRSKLGEKLSAVTVGQAQIEDDGVDVPGG